MGAAAEPTSIETTRRMEELGRIILAYSDVTEKLQKSHDQLTRTVQLLQAELGEKNRQLERKNRLAALGEMAAGMAHEIRNPLGGIQLYASVLAKDVADRAESLRIVEKISGGVRRLEALVTQVLQFTREIRPTIAPEDLAPVIAQAIEYATPMMQELGVECVVEGPATLPVVMDGALIGQAALNLIRNAAEASPAGGKVFVTFGKPSDESEARQAKLIVRDMGPGISADALEKIFNPFFTTKDDGTGLGLAIVHRIVEAHDGTIIVTNPPGGGAKFEIRI